MDTASHLVIGFTLGGLAAATAAPAVAHDPHAVHALIAAAVVGSNAPDFDTIVRVRGYESYLKHHRGFSHSLPMLLGWPVLLAAPIALLFGAGQSLAAIFGWLFAAVFLHVFLDTFNAYGVQSLRPVSRRWTHLDAVPIFDPILFAAHALVLAASLAGWGDPAVLFAALYAFTFGYIALRIAVHRRLLRLVRRRYGRRKGIFLIPGWSPFRWHYVCETDHAFHTGAIRGTAIREEVVFGKNEGDAIAQAAMGTDGVRTFLGFAHRVHVRSRKVADGYLVELRDLRFRHKNKLAFGVDVLLDDKLRVTKERLGWRKKLWEPPFA